MPAPTLTAARSVVVADDTAFVRDRFREALEDAGHHAITIGSGPELLARLREAPGAIDLVIVDLRLPGAGGVTLIRQLRTLESCPPVVVFSGTIAEAAEVRVLGSLGVAGYLNEYTAVQHIMPALLPYLSAEGRTPRRWPRAVLAVPIALRVNNTIATAVTLNVSAGGIAVRTASPLEPGTMVRLRFQLPGGRPGLDLSGRVVWGDRRLGMGLEFVDVSDGDRAVIDGFVQEHFFSYRKG